MSKDPSRGQGLVSFAALMPHAPVLVPLVAGPRLSEVAATVEAMRHAAARFTARRPDTLVAISPHSPRRRSAFGIWMEDRLVGGLAQFGADDRLFDWPVDREFARALAQAAQAAGVDAWEISDRPLDHGAVVPLSFLAEAQWRGPTVVLSLNEPGASGQAELGAAIAQAAQQTGRRVAILASGDMSHCLTPDSPVGFHPRAESFDRAFINALRAGAYREISCLDPELRDLAAEDVVDSTVVALAAVDWAAVGHQVLSYHAPFGVGYGVAILFDPAAADAVPAPDAKAERALPHPSPPAAHGEALPQIARQSVLAALLGTKEKPPGPTNPYLAQRYGVFVTIRDHEGNLRGCIGSITPLSDDLVAETWRMAREAALADQRFSPVTLAELAQMRFDVSVLHALENIGSIDQLEPRRYGLVVTAPDGRRGILLPDIPGIDTGEQQFRCTCKKGSIGLCEDVQLARFEIDKFPEAG